MPASGLPDGPLSAMFSLRKGRRLPARVIERRRRGEQQITCVLLVEHHAAFRDALTSLLNMQPDLEVVGCAGALAEGRAALAP